MTPIETMTLIPYGKQSISKEDREAVLAVLESDFLTQGPRVPEFEQAVADYCSAKHAVAVNSATSALHIAYLALGLGPGDALWTSPITFVATSNAALYCGASVDFVDVEPDTGNLSAEALEEKLKACEEKGKPLPNIVTAVHLAGLSCDMERIHALSQKYGFSVVEDASHAIGGTYRGEPVGSCRFSSITVFSFHPVKVMTTGEGGMAVTNDSSLARKMERLRSHGVTKDPALMYEESPGDWYYEQIELGFNYRITELQAALGLSQIGRLDQFVEKRNELATRYDSLLAGQPLDLPARRDGVYSAFHLYQIRMRQGKQARLALFNKMRENKIGVQVHYIPVHTQPYYKQMGFSRGMFPVAENYSNSTISLPLFFELEMKDQKRVVQIIEDHL